MEILLFGGGALGMTFGALLSKANHHVTMIGRERHVDAIQKNGIHVSGIWGQHAIHIDNAFDSMEHVTTPEFDVVLVSVKSFDTYTAIQACKDFIGKNTIVVSLQNGLGNVEAISETVGSEHVLGSCIMFGAEVTGPGSVSVTVWADKVHIGSPYHDIAVEDIKFIAEQLTEAGIETIGTDEITKYIWAKFLFNASVNALAALLEQTLGELAADTETVLIMNKIIEEIFFVAHCVGVELFWQTPEEYQQLLYTRLIPSTAHHRPSMLQDIMNGKKTEIDALNGYIVRIAHTHGLQVPVNELITALIKDKEIRRQTRLLIPHKQVITFVGSMKRQYPLRSYASIQR